MASRYFNAMYMSGRDGLMHATKRDGTSLCAMERAQPPAYFNGYKTFATCVECLTRLWRQTA